MKHMIRTLMILVLFAGTADAQEPSMKCSFGSCTVENGLTDDMLAQFRTKSGNKENISLTLNNVGNDDIKKLPALKDVLQTLIFRQKGSQITDLTPLAELQNLKKLQVRECENLKDLTPLSSLQSLESLDLYALKNLSDLTPLASVKGLKILTLTNLGKPIDLAPLGQLTALQELRISQGVAYSGFDFLAPLQNLEKVAFLAEPPDVIDITALSDKPKLKELTFSAAKINDLTALKSSPELTKLALNGANVSDLSVLKDLKKLTSLEMVSLSASDIDLTPVGELTGLTFLDLSNSTFTNYAVLARCARLESFSAKGKTNFADLTVLSPLANLKRLNLWENTRVQQWEALASLTKLEGLHVGRTSFTDLALMADMTQLKELGIHECTVSHFETLVALPSLTNLNVSGAKGISDISVLKAAPQIAKLLVGSSKEQFPQEQLDALKKAKEEAKKSK